MERDVLVSRARAHALTDFIKLERSVRYLSIRNNAKLEQLSLFYHIHTPI